MSGNTRYNPGYQVFVLPSFSGGLNTDSIDLNPSELICAQNVDFDASGNVTKRNGTFNLVETDPIAGSDGILGMVEHCVTSVSSKNILLQRDGSLWRANHSGVDYPIVSDQDELGALDTVRASMIQFKDKVFASTISVSKWTDGIGLYNNGITPPVISTANITQTLGGTGTTTENVECEFKGTPPTGFSCIGVRYNDQADNYVLCESDRTTYIDPSRVGDVTSIVYTYDNGNRHTLGPTTYTVTKDSTKVLVVSSIGDNPSVISNVVVAPPNLTEYRYRVGEILTADIASITNVRTEIGGTALTLTTDYTIEDNSDGYTYILLVAKPSSWGDIYADVVGNPDTATYQFSATYVRSTGAEIESNGATYVEREISVGSGFNVIFTVPVSADPQVTHIRLYISSSGGATPYWKDIADIANTGNPSYTFTEAQILATSGVAVPTENVAPPKAKYLLNKANRIFYANTDDADLGKSVVKWSETNNPHGSGTSSYQTFDASDSEEITGIGGILNYVVVFKKNKAWLMDAYDFGKIDIPGCGCSSHWSIQSVLNGAFLTFLSESGVCMFDGQTVRRISRGKVDRMISTYVDRSKVLTETASWYHQEQKKYVLALPKKGGGQLILVCHFLDTPVWSEYILDDEVTCSCVVVKSDGRESVLIATKNGTDAYILETEYAPDMSTYRYSQDHVNDNNVTPITMKIVTVPLHMGSPGAVKQLRRMYLDWRVAANREAYHYDESHVSVAGNPYPGYATVKCFSAMGATEDCSKNAYYEAETVNSALRLRSAAEQLVGRRNDRLDLRCKDEAPIIEITDTSVNSVTINAMNLMYWIVSNQGVEEAL